MPAQPQIVCSLSTTELPVRLAEIADLGRTALLGARTEGTHTELLFAGGADVRERVDAIVAAESRCCGFLTMRVSDAPPNVLVTVDAPNGAENVLADLVGALRGQTHPPR